MKIKDLIRILIFKFSNKDKNILLGRGNIIKRSEFEGKNIIGDRNKILNSEIGFGTYFGSENSMDKVKIGRYCSVASKLEVISGSHPLKNNVSIHPAFYLNKYKKFNKIELSYIDKNLYEDNNLIDKKWNTIIGNDVWVGYDTKILQGVKIGDGAVIGAGAVVVKDVEPYSIVGGVPAKLIRKRFSEDEIDFLLNLEWWNKDEEWIKENAENFNDIDRLKNNNDYRRKNEKV
jgi:acetyltransferase-like isoleucine patch superfamily enzyme